MRSAALAALLLLACACQLAPALAARGSGHDPAGAAAEAALPAMGAAARELLSVL
jgi:hypothetical protein